MKKVMIIVAVCTISATAFGQVKFGVKAGGNLSNSSGINWSEHSGSGSGNDWIGGFHAGGYVNYSFNTVLGAQAEAVFSMQGGKYFEKFENGSYSIDKNGEKIYKIDGIQRMNYVNVPLLLDIKPFKVPVSFFAGPQFGYCVSRTYVEGLIESDAEYSSEYKNFDFAAALGVQYTFIKHLTVGLRANIGLTPTFKYDYDYDYEYEVFDDNNIIIDKGIAHAQGTAKGKRNNVLQLSVGWTF